MASISTGKSARGTAVALAFLAGVVTSSVSLAASTSHSAASLCDAEQDCGILMGSTRQEPRLASLVNDIIHVLGAPKYKWIRKGYTPEHSDPVTENIEDEQLAWKGKLVYMSAFLSDCYSAAESLAKFILPQCHRWIQKPRIVEKPIHWDRRRTRLMSDYLRRNTGNGDTHLVPKLIVTHWTGGGTFQSAFNEFDRDQLSRPEAGRPSLAHVAGRVNYSCHYIVDRDGTIYHLMPDNLPARHVIGLNQDALCIENVGGARGRQDLTSAEAHADARLIEYLVEKYPSIEAMIGHIEFHDLKGTELFEERLKGYDDSKPDPGRIFLHEVRGLIRNRCE